MSDRGSNFDRRDFQARSRQTSQGEEAYDYVVKAGDTLSALAEVWLGSPARWPEIVKANPGRIADPDRIRPGLRLLIPIAGGRVVSGLSLPRDRDRRDRVFLTYRNLPKVERMAFWKLLDEVEQGFTKEDVARSKLDWLPTTGVALPLNDAAALYRAYSRMAVADRISIAAAIPQTETEFGPDDVNAYQPERKITADELLPNWGGPAKEQQ
jgi:hypothetical protein